MPEQITVSVDPDLAEMYRSASDDERRKLDLIINLRLRDAIESRRSLQDIMLEISRNAQERGMTPEILQSILDEECPALSLMRTSFLSFKWRHKSHCPKFLRKLIQFLAGIPERDKSRVSEIYESIIPVRASRPKLLPLSFFGLSATWSLLDG